jgi:hypothetical protein
MHGATYSHCALIAEIARQAKKGGRNNLKNSKGNGKGSGYNDGKG